MSKYDSPFQHLVYKRANSRDPNAAQLTTLAKEAEQVISNQHIQSMTVYVTPLMWHTIIQKDSNNV